MLTDPKVVDVVENLRPNWEVSKVQQFSEVPNPFAIEPVMPVDADDKEALKANFGVYVQKQRVLEAVLGWLNNSSEEDIWTNGKKTVLSNISKGKFENALSLTSYLPNIRHR